MHRTYVRRRAVATLAAAAMIAGLSGLAAAPVSRVFGERGVSTVSQRSYVVRTGDTLWSIATQLSAGSDPRPLIRAIERVDDVQAAAIVPGERLVIPDLGG